MLKIFREYCTDFITALHTLYRAVLAMEISVRSSVCQTRELW